MLTKTYTNTSKKAQKKRLYSLMNTTYGTTKFNSFRSRKIKTVFKASVKSIANRLKNLHSLGEAMHEVRETLRYFDTEKYSENYILMEQYVFSYVMAAWAFAHGVNVKAVFYAAGKASIVTTSQTIAKLKKKSIQFRNKYFDAIVNRYIAEYQAA